MRALPAQIAPGRHNLSAVSPAALRRYRAERTLRRDFAAQRSVVLRGVEGKLRAGGQRLDTSDLEACYAQAWQGLYAELLAGEQVANPTGWLVLVTYRRALDEQAARERARRGAVPLPVGAGSDELDPGVEPDFAGLLDDRDRLRGLLEGLSGRLDPLERRAAVLCYLQGMTRAEAAEHLGISERRMRRVMEGRSDGRPGVAAKVGALVTQITAGAWCDEQGSLIRAYAFGVLDPVGERRQLAEAHLSHCPACRAHVQALRGLAAVLPPIVLAPGITASLVRGHAGAAGGSAGAGGGWMLASGGAAKVAATCALAVSVGAGCVALTLPHAAPPRRPDRAPRAAAALPAATAAVVPAAAPRSAPVRARAGAQASVAGAPALQRRRAAREFGIEQQSTPAAAGASAQPVAAAASAPASGEARRAEREFSPG